MFQKGTSIQANTYFRPVISAIYSTIYNIFGPRPFFFHFFQIIFHIVTAVLIFYLFKRFFKKTISFFLALIFLVHPTNVEAISFASAMQEVLFTLTGIVGLYLLVIPSKEGIQTKMDSRLRGNDIHVQVFFATLLLFVALLMKETAIVFFLLAFFYMFIYKRSQTKILINFSIFTVILLMIYFLLRLSSGNLYVQGQGLFPIMRVSLMTRLINIPSIVLYYLTMFFYPFNLAIAQHWVVKTINFQNFWLPLIIVIGFFLLFLCGFIFVSSPRPPATLCVALRAGRRGSMDSRLHGNDYIFFFLWFLIGLLPHLQIIPINMTVAERWLYFPMIGLLGMIGSIMSSSRRRGSRLLFSLGVVIILIFSMRSFVRTLDWRNGLTLFSHDIKKNSSFDLQNNFGTELFRVGRYEEAKKYFEISTKLAPYWWVNWNNLGASYEHEKNYQKAAEYYQKSIDSGQYYLAYENLAKILVFHGKDKKRAEQFLQKSLDIFPNNPILLQVQAYQNASN